ncbi:uncharacterized protein LOC108511891 [Phoenix dactylifera]|uniref:Uncharacterized protein LOC108511891 n=1 Tax=Phoenix dactylifera TaxID=42345 RepID=A0A8B9AAT5_PHODC|nr:uncharacterized protein LOC108511891 [Phoenix dactylifera]
MELRKSIPLDKETSPPIELLEETTKFIDVERVETPKSKLKMARKHTYYGKGEGVLPMYHEEAIDFFLQENHMEHTIWEDADTLKPSCNGDAIEQLLHDGPLRSDVVNIYFRVMEL